ncbi:MAG: hypothetical protein J6I72_04530 [Muribaculaceae bacterium]|nr:hypothetical protein [Muribaculaceae bacterium]
MKKFLMILCAALFCAGVMSSCSSDKDGDEPSKNKSELEKNYFSIENGTYVDGDFPSATSSEDLEGVTINDRALTGGMNFITIITEKVYKRFFVGVKGIRGYWVFTAITQNTSGGYNTYIIPIMYSTLYNSDIVMIVAGENGEGKITRPYNPRVKHVDSESGDLNLNLTFSNAKDIDLHMVTPSGEHIFFGHRGGTVSSATGGAISYGLDHDSNAACYLDYLNNENIYIPSAMIEDGTYKVYVNMFANCNRNIATSWCIVARYKGNILKPERGVNPATGVYAVGAGEGDMTQVMEFKLTRSAKAPLVDKSSFRPTPISDMDEMKMEEAEYRMTNMK